MTIVEDPCPSSGTVQGQSKTKFHSPSYPAGASASHLGSNRNVGSSLYPQKDVLSTVRGVSGSLGGGQNKSGDDGDDAPVRTPHPNMHIVRKLGTHGSLFRDLIPDVIPQNLRKKYNELLTEPEPVGGKPHWKTSIVHEVFRPSYPVP